jgi:hypothetical protein
MKLRQLSPALSTIAAVCLALSLGCQGKSMNMSRVEETLAKMSEKQDTILSKLEALEAKGPAAPQKRPQKGRPDPKAVYKVAVNDAHAKGPADAKITIVSWSEFQ